MIIFGTKGITRTKDVGQFACPRCAQASNYSLRVQRRWFTLYFIPLIPLNEVGRYVECQGCMGTWEESILEYDPHAEQEKFRARYHEALREAMVIMTAIDGSVADAELHIAARVYQEFTGEAIDLVDLRTQAQTVQSGDEDPLLETLRGYAGVLNDNGKELVIRAVFHVAGADGDYADDEMRLISRCGEALGMTTAHTQGVLDQELRRWKEHKGEGG